ncbi:dimethylsulfonioproprionate lyase family protein [Marimonas sp. MJW-29]|uniref:Dimethylsulfonioproprionate lyase family protein n=1 Tax=Sulfitobacter sediminis TaxID=3234186 RepID=A0ABV3RHE6_9RHOB
MLDHTDHDLLWDGLLTATREAYAASAALSAFSPFAGDIRRQPVTPFHVAAAALFAAEAGLYTDSLAALRDAFRSCAPLAQWRETYKETDIGQDFMDRFGCYCLIGEGGAFASDTMAAWLVYMPPHLYYPWHQHPAEEMYLVVAGEALFLRHGEAPEVLRPGQTSAHASNQPHAMQTFDHPVMALVVWRNGFDSPPVLTPKDVPTALCKASLQA